MLQTAPESKHATATLRIPTSVSVKAARNCRSTVNPAAAKARQRPVTDGEASRDRTLDMGALENIERPVQDAEHGMVGHFRPAAIASFDSR